MLLLTVTTGGAATEQSINYTTQFRIRVQIKSNKLHVLFILMENETACDDSPLYYQLYWSSSCHQIKFHNSTYVVQ